MSETISDSRGTQTEPVLPASAFGHSSPLDPFRGFQVFTLWKNLPAELPKIDVANSTGNAGMVVRYKNSTQQQSLSWSGIFVSSATGGGYIIEPAQAQLGNSFITVDNLIYGSAHAQYPVPVQAKPTRPQIRWSHRNSGRVREFLSEFPDIGVLLKETEESLVHSFGAGTEVVLEVMNYPEEGAEDELVAWIRSSGNVEIAIEKLDQFVERWSERIWNTTGSRFNFNIEVV